jgi:uncharacterized secreted protein with C-terminal beta-propeller domain
MKKLPFILLGSLLVSSFLSLPVSAKTLLTDLPRSDWAKYGINPWKLDTDNDGIKDSEEIQNGQCPTSADPISLTDKNCKKGRFNLVSQTYTQPLGATFLKARDIKRFVSCSELTKTISDSQSAYQPPVFYSLGANTPIPTALPTIESIPSTALSTRDYSATNIQVAGVDEGDIIKTDGKNIYYLANNSLVIASADPNVSQVISKTPLDSLMTAQEIYLDGSKILVIGTNYSQKVSYPVPLNATTIAPAPASIIARPSPILPFPNYVNQSHVVATLLDITDQTNPSIIRSVEVSGNLVTSRLTNGYAYLVLNSYIPYYYSTATKTLAGTSFLPEFRDVKTDQAIAKLTEDNSSIAFQPLANCTDVEYLTPSRGNGFLQVIALPVTNPQAPLGKKIIWGANSGDEVYASPTNLYVASPNYQYRYWGNNTERTELYKFNFNKNTIKLAASQTIPGTVLNQFSMDESNGYFRLATTERTTNSANGFTNHLLVLNDDLSRIGSVDNFSPTEKIYSARFVNNRAYIVTFRQIDPFSVFDLTNPRSPQLIGELQIPGYSNYLQPYDDTHIIGIGKNTASSEKDSGFVWYQGMKLGLFDVTNPNQPIQLFKTDLGDRGTDSPALTDHHALLFSKDKNLLAFPVNIFTLSDEQRKSTSTAAFAYGQNTFQGLIAYNLDLVNGFKELGRITHMATSTTVQPYYYGYGADAVKRSLYIGDKFYVASDKQLTIHKLFNLAELGLVKF